jgi:Protein of unknown function (DUF3800)
VSANPAPLAAGSERKPAPRLCAYADESHYNCGRHRAVALLTLRQADAVSYRREIGEILAASNVGELKWNRLNSARARFAAQKILAVILDGASRSRIRVDVLLWDTRDRRHIVNRRDDIANLQRMYYHLLKNVLQARWPDYSVWYVFPDEHTSLNWNQVEDFLDRASMKSEVVRDLLTNSGFKIRLRTEFQIKELTPCKSHLEPLIQVADIFAGLGAYSYDGFEAYCEWKRQNSAQSEMFAQPNELVSKLSGSDRERCCVLADFDRACKSRTLGVSLETHRGLRTFNPKNPINFWLYVPQHEKDLAPTR